MKSKVIYCGLFSLLLLAGCQSNQTTTPTSTPASSSAPTAETTNQNTTSSSTNTNQVIKVSADKAIELFQSKYPNTAITSLELDSDWGNYFYKVEGVDDQNEYSMKVDAATEKVSTQNSEKLDRDEQNGQKKTEDALDTSKLLSIEKAAQIAVDKVGGGTATDWDLSKDLGTTYWEVKVKNGNQTTQIKINSQTGEVLSTEMDD